MGKSQNKQMRKVFDKNNKEIKVGDLILISNSRGCCNKKGKVEIVNTEYTGNHDVLGYRLLSGHEKGKRGTLSMWERAIWKANDTPENFLEVIHNENKR